MEYAHDHHENHPSGHEENQESYLKSCFVVQFFEETRKL
jgi:hypothetical protein